MGKYTWDGYFVKKGDTAIIATQSPIQSEVLLQELASLQATIDLCRERGFITPEGEVRKVLGTLPVTKDGVYVGWGATLYCPSGHKNNHHGARVYCLTDGCWSSGCQGDSGSGQHYNFDQCYSTRAAALAATHPPADEGKAGGGGNG